jgi:hypothetical protein
MSTALQLNEEYRLTRAALVLQRGPNALVKIGRLIRARPYPD